MVRLTGLCEADRCLHNESMPNVLIRDLPADVHAALVRRAATRGQSLQQYLTGELQRLADRPTIDEVLAGITGLEGGRIGLQQAVDGLAEERDRR